MLPGASGSHCTHPGDTVAIKGKIGKNYVLQTKYKKTYVLDPRCMCVVGQVSNPEYDNIPIGSVNRLRDLGWRPKSGLWQRKTGYHGRKIHDYSKPQMLKPKLKQTRYVELTSRSEDAPFKVIQNVDRRQRTRHN